MNESEIGYKVDNLKRDHSLIKNQLKEKRQRIHNLKQRLSSYQTKHKKLLKKEEEIEKKSIELEINQRKEKEEKERLEKERKALYEELQQQAMTTTMLSHPQKITFSSNNNYFDSISEQDAIAWLRQQ